MDGYLTLDELRHILTNVGNPMPAQDVRLSSEPLYFIYSSWSFLYCGTLFSKFSLTLLVQIEEFVREANNGSNQVNYREIVEMIFSAEPPQ